MSSLSQYYSASELAFDNDITTTPTSTNTNSRIITNELSWKDFDDNNEENIISLHHQDQNSSNVVNNNNDVVVDDDDDDDEKWTLLGSPIASTSQEETSIPEKLTNSMVNYNKEIFNRSDNNKRDGIFVTTVKVVEVYNSVGQNDSQKSKITEPSREDIDNSQRLNNKNDDKIQQNMQLKNLQKKNSQSVKQHSGIPIKKEERRRSRKAAIRNENTSPIIPSKSRLQNSNVKRSSTVKRVQLKRSLSVMKNNPRMRRQMEYAPTSNPKSSNDPTDMEADLPPIKNPGFPWIPGSAGPPKLIHASLVPLSQHNKNHLNSNLRHTRYPSIQMNKTSRLPFNPRKTLTRLMSPEPPNSTKKEQKSLIQLEERISLEVKPGNRASQIFRRKLLEQSLAMSFNELMTNNVSQSQQRSLIRKRTKKGSNARLEDREARRERRRKEKMMEAESSNNKDGEKLEKRLEAESSNGKKSESEKKKMETKNSNKNGENLKIKDKMKDDEKTEINKTVVMSKILDSDKLEKMVVAELKKKDTLVSPQPPLRRKTNEDNIIIPSDSTSNLTQRTETLALPQPLLRRKTNENITPIDLQKTASISTELPLFPTHLSPRKRSATEGSKLYVGSPLQFSATTTPSEELDITADFIKPTIVNDEGTKNNVEVPASPIVTSPVVTSPVSSIPVPTASRYNRLGMSLFGLFNKRETNSNFPLSPKSPKSPSNFSVPQKSPKSPIKTPTSFSFLPRYSRSSSPSPNPTPSSSSQASQIPNPTNSQASKSSRTTSSNPKTSSTSNQTLTSTSNTYPSSSRSMNPSSPKSRFTTLNSRSTPNPLKLRPVTPNLLSSPRQPSSPKTFSLPSSPVSPRSPSSPLNPLKNSEKTSKILRPGYTRQVTDIEKLRKMQKFEAIIAKTEANNKNAPNNARTNKIRALKTAIKSTTTAMSSPVSPVTSSFKRKDSAASSSTIDGNYINNIDRRKTSLKSEKDNQDSRTSTNSDTIHYNPNQKENIGQSSADEDGVIRFTITPAVCR